MSDARDRLNGSDSGWREAAPAATPAPVSRVSPRTGRRLAPSTQNRAVVKAEIDRMIEDFDIKTPKHWDKYGTKQKLDFISTRLIAMNRTTTSFTEMKEEGILSVSQYDRRVRREVYSRQDSLDAVPPVRGVFGRVHSKRPKRPSARDVI